MKGLPGDTYYTIQSRSEGLFKDKGSKFIGLAFPISSEEELKKHLAELRNAHPSARHICYAFRINPEKEYWRTNDDGEPSSSAGKPILGQIRSYDLQNVLVAVVRYFGGTLLGVPGLIHAYKTAAGEALSAATVIMKTITRPLLLSVPYEQTGEVMKWVKSSGFEYDPPEMQEACTLRVWVPLSACPDIQELLAARRWLKER